MVVTINTPMMIYPRKCQHCEYIANNPQMYSYHKRIHETIPVDKRCDHGCGFQAQYRNTAGTYTCERIAFHCPALQSKIAIQVKEHWQHEATVERKKQTRERFITTVHNEECIGKAKRTKREHLLSYDNTKPRRRYNWAVHKSSQYTLREMAEIVNPNNLAIGKTEAHLDHLVSKHVGFLLNIPVKYMSDAANLRVVSYTENIKKGPKCLIHPCDLLIRCGAPLNLLQEVYQKIQELSIEHLIPR